MRKILFTLGAGAMFGVGLALLIVTNQVEVEARRVTNCQILKQQVIEKADFIQNTLVWGDGSLPECTDNLQSIANELRTMAEAACNGR